MKVLHIASGDLWAGAEVQLFTLAKALACMPGIEPEVVLLNHGRLEEELRSAGIRVSVIDESQFNGIKMLVQLINLLRKAKPDLVHTHRLKENILGSVAAFITGNIPSLRTVHGAPEYPPSWKQPSKAIIYWLDWVCGRFLQDKIISVSDNLAELLKQKFPTEKIHTIENGVDLDAIQLHRSKNKVIDDNGIFKIAIVGRLVPVKRIDLFIKTARYMLDQHPDLKTEFYIYGDGPLADELKQLSHELKTDSVITFAGHCDDVLDKISQMDVLLVTSDHEGLPMTLLEAMVLKTPILAHAVGGIPMLLDYGKCGILVENHNPEGYAQEIIKLTSDSKFRKKITDDALTRVTEQYSAERNARAYRKQYKDLTSV